LSRYKKTAQTANGVYIVVLLYVSVGKFVGKKANFFCKKSRFLKISLEKKPIFSRFLYSSPRKKADFLNLGIGNYLGFCTLKSELGCN
jgi:hypothetical protein